MQKVVYLAHPLSGSIQLNIARAKAWYRWVLTNFDVAVIADWIISCEVLDDTNPEHRTRGMAANAMMLPRCDELWLFGERISAGMQTEIMLARAKRIPIMSFLELGNSPPPTYFAPRLFIS